MPMPIYWLILLGAIIFLVNVSTVVLVLVAIVAGIVGGFLLGFHLGYQTGLDEVKPQQASPPPPKSKAPKVARHWRILGLKPGASIEAIEQAYRTLAKKKHPDHGGTLKGMQELNLARDLARREVQGKVSA